MALAKGQGQMTESLKLDSVAQIQQSVKSYAKSMEKQSMGSEMMQDGYGDMDDGCDNGQDAVNDLLSGIMGEVGMGMQCGLAAAPQMSNMVCGAANNNVNEVDEM